MVTINNIQVIIHNIKDLVNIYAKHKINYEQIFDVRADHLEQLDDADFNIMCDFISQCANLKSIYLPNISIKILDEMLRLSLLCNSISKCVQLESLNLTGLKMEAVSWKQLEHFSKTIGSLQNLKSLTLAWIPLNVLTIQNIKMLFNVVDSLSVLQTLNLEGVGLDEIDDERFQIVCDTICKCHKLKNIELYQIELDYMDSERFDKLCDTISKSCSLMYCIFKSKQTNMIEERNQTIEKILQKKQVPTTQDLGDISYFFAKQKLQICKKRIREDESLLTYDGTLKSAPSYSCCAPTLRP